ncbi:MAG: coproporphyrinogen dehydrogenase HemZ [Ruminococcus sp.]|nr:coproporphyrinogen dehydrogenase HemZ [Ruminococcus sp.]
MTVIFSGNDFKYEIEGVLKLFIPAQRFDFCYDDRKRVEGDFVFVRIKRTRSKELLYALCRIDGRCEREAEYTGIKEGQDDELRLSRLLYKAMSRLTGTAPMWGVITGIRPVKQVNRLLSKGLSGEEIYSVMEREYLCSRDKISIALSTASTQERILAQMPDRSFSLYISIPVCPTRCSYCSFISQTYESARKLMPEYLEKLGREIRYTGQLVKELGLRLDTVYFGGGTPTTLTAGELSGLMKAIEYSFDMSSVREYTIEAGRPDTITGEKLRAIKENGCTRISINPQTLNESVLRAIGREHTPKMFFDSFELARRVGFDCINTDIIAGLPTDTEDSFSATVEKLIELSPENYTVHTLSIKRRALLNNGDRSVLDNPADRMVAYATERLSGSGYQPYYLYRQKNMVGNLENIGWSKPGQESLYNIYIMEEVQTIIALGAGASTKLLHPETRELKRIFNYKYPLEYIKHFDIMIKKKDEIREFYMGREDHV